MEFRSREADPVTHPVSALARISAWTLLVAGAAGAPLALTLPAWAQQTPQQQAPAAQAMPPQRDDTTSLGRQHSGPAGDSLVRPSDPRHQPQGPVMQPQVSKDNTAATNAISTTGPGTPGERGEVPTTQPPGAITTGPELGVPQSGSTLPAPATREPVSPSGTRGGGLVGANQARAEDLNGMTVHLKDAREFGEVSGVVLDLDRGTVAALLVSESGAANLLPGQKVFDVPWNQVGWVDKAKETIQLNVARADLTPDTAAQIRQQAR